MVEIMLNLEVDCPVGKEEMLSVAKSVANLEKKVRGIVEVTVVTGKTIKKLNKQYRNKDSITDVLSFSLIEGEKSSGPFLGEIYICWSQIKSQAKELNIEPNEEFLRMLSHGLLHLVGYDHIKRVEADKMFKIQELALKKSGIIR